MLGVEVGESGLDKDNFPKIEDMVSVYTRLVIINKKSDVI